MAKYYNSPWGTIIGKLGYAIGSVYRGRQILRVYRKPKDTGNPELIKSALRGEIDKKEISISSMNQRRMIFGMINRIAYQNLSSLIYPVWEPSARRKGITGINLFAKYNIPSFYDSMPDKEKIYSYKNKPSLSSIVLTEGNLEPAIIKETHYNKKTGRLTVIWDTHCYSCGAPSDFAYIMAIYWYMPKKAFYKDTVGLIKCWGNAKEPIGKREEGEGEIFIKENLNPRYLTAFLFFKTPKIGYSPSESSQVTK
ncbi:hypothetical protein KAW65_06665 [candidate division WOR-3 bacterium]|nr:hypothetical protein [candidate division WOR-3 bacterium]